MILPKQVKLYDKVYGLSWNILFKSKWRTVLLCKHFKVQFCIWYSIVFYIYLCYLFIDYVLIIETAIINGNHKTKYTNLMSYFVRSLVLFFKVKWNKQRLESCNRTAYLNMATTDIYKPFRISSQYRRSYDPIPIEKPIWFQCIHELYATF